MKELELKVRKGPGRGVQVIGINKERMKPVFIHRVSVTGKDAAGKPIQITFFYPKVFVNPRCDLSLVDNSAVTDGVTEISASADYFVVNRRAYSQAVTFSPDAPAEPDPKTDPGR